jgi:hypothetical protein
MIATTETPTITACRLSLRAAAERDDCDMVPAVAVVEEHFDARWPQPERGCISVDVTYSSKGYRALYGYRVSDGELSLWQD